MGKEKKQNSPAVSVVVTCYNYGKYLAGCLDSILAQSYSDLEIIVIDDGSTDDTPEVMSRYSHVAHLRYIQQANAGQARAKNKGIQEARGRFIAFLDADDLWREDKLALQMPLFDKPEVGVVYSGARFIDADGQALPEERKGEYLRPQAGRVSNGLLMDNFVWFSSSVVRADCFESLGQFDEALKMGIDWDLWLRFSSRYEFDYVDEPLLDYRIGHAGQMSRNMEERHRCADRIMNRFLNQYGHLVREKTVHEAHYYTFCNRGYFFKLLDKKKSISYYLMAIREQPAKSKAYVGLLKSLVHL